MHLLPYDKGSPASLAHHLLAKADLHKHFMTHGDQVLVLRGLSEPFVMDSPAMVSVNPELVVFTALDSWHSAGRRRQFTWLEEMVDADDTSRQDERSLIFFAYLFRALGRDLTPYIDRGLGLRSQDMRVFYSYARSEGVSPLGGARIERAYDHCLNEAERKDATYKAAGVEGPYTLRDRVESILTSPWELPQGVRVRLGPERTSTFYRSADDR